MRVRVTSELKRSSTVFSRKPDFEVDLSTTEGCARYALFYIGLAANVAGACMSDHIGDERVVCDMHDVIGALGAALNAVQLLQVRSREQ